MSESSLRRSIDLWNSDASGAPLEVDMWMLCEFRGERFTRIQCFLDRDAALVAAGS
jgi:ketosteroid isomerase-like protein